MKEQLLIIHKNTFENDIVYIKCQVSCSEYSSTQEMFDHFPSLHGQLWSGYKDVFLQSAFEAKLIDSIRSMPSLLTSLSIYPIPWTKVSWVETGNSVSNFLTHLRSEKSITLVHHEDCELIYELKTFLNLLLLSVPKQSWRLSFRG